MYYEIFGSLYFVILLAHFSLLIFLMAYYRNELKKPFKKIPKYVWVSLLLIIIFALFLRITMSGRYGLDDLLWEHVRKANNAFESLGFSDFAHTGGHSLLATFALFLWNDTESISLLTIIFDTFSILLVFCLSYLLFRKKEISLISSLIFAIIPWQIFISGMGLGITSSVFFVLLTLTVLLISKELKSVELLVLSTFLLLWSCEIKIENLMFGVFFVFVYLRSDYRLKLKDIRIFLPLILIFFAPLLFWILNSPSLFGIESSVEGQGDFLSLQNMAKNFPDYMVPHFINRNGNFYPPFIFILSAIGILLFRQQRKGLYFLFIWLLIWFLIYGSYWNGVQIWRYSLMIHPVFAILSACGFYVLIKYSSGFLKVKGIHNYLLIVVVIFIVFSTFPVNAFLGSYNIYSWPSIKEFKEIDQKIEDDSCVVLQRLKYGRLENAKLLIDKDRTFIEWPTEENLFDYNCEKIYYFNLRYYIHPRPEDIKEYEENQELFFQNYKTEKFLSIRWLEVYEILGVNF